MDRFLETKRRKIKLHKYAIQQFVYFSRIYQHPDRYEVLECEDHLRDKNCNSILICSCNKKLGEKFKFRFICILYLRVKLDEKEMQPCCYRVRLIPSLALTPLEHLHLSTWFARVNDTLWITRITIAGFDSAECISLSVNY